MKLPSLRSLMPWRKRATENTYRPGPYLLSDGWLSKTAGKFSNFWQLGYNVQPYAADSAIVQACISAYAQTIAMCPGNHWRALPNGGRERVTNSALCRIIKRPNDYQSISDFLLNLTRALYMKGEAFAYAVRNDRNEIVELHLMREGRAAVSSDPDDPGGIYYALYGNDVAERRFDLSYAIPARDVLHVRLETPRDSLKGVSPILSTALSLALSGAAMNQQVAFYLNGARPSFTLETDQKLTPAEVKSLREIWNEQTNGENAGGTPILSWGLKANPVSVNANDNQLAALLKMSQEEVALAFRIPMQVLGIGGTPFASTEALMSAWEAQGLGFALNHIEEAIGNLFRLSGQPDEWVEFDTAVLMRSSFKERIEALAQSVGSGLHAHDEARNALDLPVVPGGVGKVPRVNQAQVPLSYGAKMIAPDPNAAPPQKLIEGPKPKPEGEEDDSNAEPADRGFTAGDLLSDAKAIEHRAAA